MAEDNTNEGVRIHPAAIGAGILVVLLVVFVLQNTKDVDVDYLWMSTSKPLWVVIVIIAVVAVAAREIIAFALRHRKR